MREGWRRTRRLGRVRLRRGRWMGILLGGSRWCWNRGCRRRGWRRRIGAGLGGSLGMITTSKRKATLLAAASFLAGPAPRCIAFGRLQPVARVRLYGVFFGFLLKQ